MSSKKLLSLFVMMLFCGVGFAQDKEVMVVRQTDGKEVRYDVAKVEKVYVETESPSPEMEYVDLGLSVKWATCNLGASKPEEYGDHYGWGSTEPYAEGEDVDWPLYFQKIGGTGSSDSDCGTYKDPIKEYVYPNNKSIAGTKWDAARQKLGGSWRMPTIEEIEELMDDANSIFIWTTINGVNGYKIMSKKPGYEDRYIFLPAAGRRIGTELHGDVTYGRYWSATPDDTRTASQAYSLGFYSDDFGWGGDYDRCDGRSVRPVYVPE